ncbi:MAG TPA: hypothetical protein VHO24_02820 [Opitutaceae bacterium]|nr:hypothetical protein [Opitutaceae bacterium]
MPLKILSVLLLVALMAGCKVDLPAVDAGTVEINAGGRITKRELSKSQVKTLSDWIRTHQTGWSFKVEDSFPGRLISLKRGSATVAVVDMTGENRIKIKNLVRTLTPEDRTLLETVLASFSEFTP